MYDLIIIGGGPAGLTAGIYAVRYGMDTVVLEKNVLPGQIAATDMVENYTGFTAISGPELMQRFKEHAETVGVKIESAEVSSIISEDGKKVVVTDSGTLESKTVIIATGANPKKLGIPGEKEFMGKGVSYCATCDAPFYKGKTVIVVGGGESALTDALILSNVVKKVYIIHRRDKLRASRILQERVSRKPNIEIVWDTVPEEIQGKTGVENVILRNLKTRDVYTLQVDGVFVYIGIRPGTEFIDVKKNSSGFILTNEKLETSIPGIYAAGDCRDTSIWQVVTAVADGAVAAVSAHEYIMELDEQ
ncbi:MAG: Sulfide dehydrogenase subunit alpha precursor [Methanomethylovorans sp. PtaU1.Bin093]|jgi:thioredoxin reductase (NADPH)|uniref:thioredoxin-disulfide reductase n=1 Tax=Methanomethylovorans sp. PtaU1.Bin093 TaxID=1811679 RepID=UPI0009CBD3B3|nr:thioredoxin-disulfide reductase [Methanomethylovorans sp. PtaU1.Bin093]OPY21065.1 MAG: Sulfide dehydrogenase subunit alpha precursor [Methanomethylovorans sp. PtaU1.Bin093]